MKIPAPLQAGDVVAVVAPASPFPREAFLSGLAWLGQRYRLRLTPRIFARAGFLAGDDDRRRTELGEAMRDPEVRAIIVARGGYGITRIASGLPWESFASHPKWIIGFSDTTALLCEAAFAGVASVHGPNLTGLCAMAPSLGRARGAWLAAVEGPARDASFRVESIVSGHARGVLFGGNLALLCTLAAAGRLRIPAGAIVMLEDVTERPYRIDRMLTSLLEGGHLAKASAVVFGSFAQCDPGPDGVTARDVAIERTRALGVPIAWGAPFGHGDDNEAFIVGAPAELKGSTLRWSAR